MSRPQSRLDSHPRVVADNKFLRLSTMQPSVPQAPVVSQSDINVMNAENDSVLDAVPQDNRSVQSGVSTPTSKRASIDKSSSRTLQNRISSIFNNLPNDIELSDDSASDLETINNDSISASPATSRASPHHNQLKVAKNNHSPSKHSKRVPSASTTRSAESPSITSILHKTPTVSRKISANLSNSIIDGAKNIITHNMNGKTPTGHSFMDSIENLRKRKKRMARKLSENPLKNGGIPKKYWMNDSFVAECLNCLRPFTAFRRKHHCRFCGQIFCSRCTIFISYSQYKHLRKSKSSGVVPKEPKHYQDKLRVCKPCYSDVIVYLSDDSLSSSGEEESNYIIQEDGFGSGSETQDRVGYSPSQNQKMRSLSSSSRRDSSATQSLALYQQSDSLNRAKSSLSATPSLGSSHVDSKDKGIDNVPIKHAPQMAIPTTRTGEAIEIPVSRSPYSMNTMPIRPNIAVLAMKKAASHSASIPNSSGNEGGKGLWYTQTNEPVDQAPETTRPSIENIGLLYTSFIKRRSYKLQRSPSERMAGPSHLMLQSQDGNDQDGDDDAESENEDEKVMSLYTSLNHGSAHNPGTNPVLSPRLRSLSQSLLVPTLQEFPNIAVNEKYVPNVLSFGADSASPTIANPHLSGGINENKLRSDHRSSERAKASLNRMRQKRIGKLRNKNAHFTRPPLVPPPEASSTNIIFGASTTPSTPSSPTPVSFGGLGDERASDTKFSNTGTLLPEVSFTSPLDAQTHSPQRSSLKLEDSDDPVPSDTRTSVLDQIYADYSDTLIDQSLVDCDILDENEQKRWKHQLKNDLLKVQQIKITDTLDVKQYVKTKKLLGGRIEDTHVVDGIFITKDIDSKKMQSSIKNPKIALLMFPLEYLKHKEQFISLRIVGSQQAVYISNLVSRLISMEPDLIVVGDTVCGLAERLLEEANITVLSNVKPQVIERISRYTKGDIFLSVNDLFFKKGSLGTCETFEIKKFYFQDIVKTFAFFTGCDVLSGFTVCLRGGDEEYLSGTKYVTEILVPSMWNAKFEKSLMASLSLKLDGPKEKQGQEILSLLERSLDDVKSINVDGASSSMQSMSNLGIVDYVKLFSERFLSISPPVMFNLPQTYLNVIDAFVKFVDCACFDKEIQGLDPTSEIKVEWLSKLRLDIEPKRFLSTDDLIRTLQFVSEHRVRYFLEAFNQRLRNWSNCIKYNSYQLYPIFHRSIHFLHSTVSIKHATPCSGPMIVVIDYYTDNDKCLGLFLDQAIQDSSKTCEECGEPIMEHYKTYVHDNYKIDLIIERVDTSASAHSGRKMNQRIMWSFCPECNASTPISVMEDDVYNFSLGKFFELCFWARDVYHRNGCPHDYFKSHVKYFGYSDIVIRLETSPVDTYEVVVPKKKLEFTLENDVILKIETLERIRSKLNSFFKSVRDRLGRIKLDTPEKAESGYARVEQLKTRVDEQQTTLINKIESIYENTSPLNYLSLNVLQRDLQGLVIAWDNDFNDFESDYLPSESEITKITQFHLRNFLMDKFDTELADNKKEDPQKARIKPVQHASGTSNTDSLPRNEAALSSKFNNGNDDRKQSPFLGSKFRVPLAVIEDKIFQIKQSLENDNKAVPKSPTKSRTNSNSGEVKEGGQQNPKKVQDLTNYFNQMTLEFQRQREQALEKKLSKHKSLPVVNSLPIVEIYDNIEDVVDVNDTKEQKRRSLARNDSSSLFPRLSADTNQLVLVQEESPKEGEQDSVVGDRRSEILAEDRKLLQEALPSQLKNPQDVANKLRIEIPQPERNSLLKSLMNYWADRSATLWDPLEYPFDATEHTFADSDVIVREDEPSSLVAFCLSTSDYKEKISGMKDTSEDGELDAIEANEMYKKKAESFAKIEKKFKKKIDTTSSSTNELESVMTKLKSNHLRYQFVDGSTILSCKIFYSEQFDAFRKACGIDDKFIQSLSRSVKWNSKGGKSGSNFLKTSDNRFIVKELSKSELESFVSIAPFYFRYIAQSTFNTLTTAIAKIFGFYQIEIKNPVTGKTFKMDFLIMENLFYNRKCSRIFDLKGSMRNRHVKQTGKENEVLLDENMIEYIYESPVFVKEQLKKLLRGSLFNDTSFLSAMDVMDYSLVIGIDDTSKKLYTGIIDWLRTFTWDKKVENWVKGSSLVGKKGKDPTIVTPKQYRTRFREAMDRYILEVPDIWYEGK